MLSRQCPEPGHEGQRHTERCRHIRDCEEVQRSLSVQAGRYSYERVCCVDVRSNEKEGESRAQPPSRESPLVQLGQVSFPPARAIEPEEDKDREKSDKDRDYGCRIDQELASPFTRG